MRIKRLENSESADSLLILLREEDCENLPPFEGELSGILSALISRKDFTGKKGSLLRVPLVEGTIYLIGLGKKEKCNLALIRNSLAWGLRTVGKNRGKSATVLISHLNEYEGLSFALGEAGGLCGYVFDTYKTKGKDYEPFSLTEIYSDVYDDDVSAGLKFADAQIFSREIANEPGCSVCPETMAVKAREVAEKYGLECEVWDEKRLSAEKMGAILAVGSGSKNPPRLIHLTYKPKDTASKKVAIVGKGITFDSGGLNIKPDNFMLTMKGDKTGACNVLGIMKGVAELGLGVEVHGFMSCAENMPSGSSYRPDDIITARNGKTIEINNTDAEGRLVLADALCVASEVKPDVIIDMATLTGACVVALGKSRAGLFVNDDELSGKILDSSSRTGEPFWRMPLEDDDIAESMKSPFADLVNSGNRYGGAIYAALFLKEFVSDGIAWAHMDIAGVDFRDKEYGIYPKGATAFGVRTCLDYLMRL
ncbi:MAG: leucyl aminopeptidase [Synergistaceae bacterium]|nr:leucyl aminopeptidase [Synergistaceae bacterium]MBQ6418251.1 leucyl aminopeptidase [Synergistaceae bacterium]